MHNSTILPANSPARFWRMRRRVLARFGGGVAVAVLASLGAMPSPGPGVRSELAAAAAAAGRLPVSATHDGIRQELLIPFSDHVATVDPAGFPVSVVVTLHGLDRTTCLDAIATARRLEGEVVVELLDYAAPADCRDDNDMTWRFMP